ncbi:MAG: septum formation inhibitor Maf, partial [Betaproteobacteria bacterium]|nr:septum formation inhibitor Maf [Betaproteobacteria bacterium]
ARAVACDYPDALVIGSDQAATLDGSVAIGKPGNRQAAIEQLSAASGKLMQFFTALAVVRQTQGSQCVFEQCQVVETQVRFRTLSAAQIQHYVDREPAFDCAGAAKCEGLGISLMASIQSEDPTALIGLPLIRLTHMLLDAGYDLLSADSAAQRP